MDVLFDLERLFAMTFLEARKTFLAIDFLFTFAKDSGSLFLFSGAGCE